MGINQAFSNGGQSDKNPAEITHSFWCFFNMLHFDEIHCTLTNERIVRKPAFCICENKDADQLHGNSEADQRLCFRHTDSAIPLLSKSEISSL